MYSFLKLVAVTFVVFSISGCKEETSNQAQLKHPEFGLVGADHPKYLEAHALCDGRAYGKGFMINGVVYNSKAEVFEQVQKIIAQANKSKEDWETVSRWSGEIQPSFIACMAGEGFVFVRNDG